MKMIFFGLFLFLILGASWVSLNNLNSIIIIEFLDYHVEISLVLATIVLSIFVTLFFYLVYFILFIKKIPSALKGYFQAKQDHSDNELLLEGFASLFQNDLDKNKNLLKKIHNHKEDPQFQNYKSILSLLIAQSNKLQYFHDKAYNEYLEDAYMNLLQHQDMKLVALKGLVELRVENKRYYDALIYAEKALAIDSKQEWLVRALIKIYKELAIYEKSDFIIGKALNYKFITTTEANELTVQNLLAHANSSIANSEVELAIELLEKVLKIDPACYDAIYSLLELYPEQDKAAYKIIEKAWKVRPSQQLAKLLYNKSKQENLAKRVKLFENLIDANTNACEGYIILSKLYVEEKMLEKAKKTIENLLALHAPDTETIKLMALIEAKSHSNHNVIINWLNKL